MGSGTINRQYKAEGKKDLANATFEAAAGIAVTLGKASLAQDIRLELVK